MPATTDELLAEIRALRLSLTTPTVMTYEEACRQLANISLSHLKMLIRSGLVATVPLGEHRRGVSREEVERIARSGVHIQKAKPTRPERRAVAREKAEAIYALGRRR